MLLIFSHVTISVLYSFFMGRLFYLIFIFDSKRGPKGMCYKKGSVNPRIKKLT